MDKRIEIAAKILSGLVSNPGGPIQQNSQSGYGFVNCDIKDVCSLSIELADELIRQLQDGIESD